MKDKKNRNILFAPVVIAAFTFLFFQFLYPYHLFFKEQIQLFLYTPDYLFSYFDKPAALARLSGDFLTQFFYLRGGGATVLALLFVAEWIVLQHLIKKFIAEKHAGLWALLPVAVDFTLHLNLLHTPADSMGLFFSLVLIGFCLSIKNKVGQVAFVIVLVLLGNYWFGNAIILLPFFLLLQKKERQSILPLLLLLAFLIVPLVTRQHFLLTHLQAYLFPAFSLKSLWLPAFVLFAVVLAKLFSDTKLRQSVLAQSILLLVSILLVGGIKLNANFEQEKILALDSEFYFENNKTVLQLAETLEVKNRVASYYTNMALAQKGELPERLMEFYQPSIHGLILPVSQYENWQTILFSNELFYLLGDMNLAQHSAMLANTFSPYNRSSRMIKRLAEINMINEDFAGAEKFLRMLDKTLFHKKWAQKRLAENNAECKKIWLAKKRQQIAQTDIIRTAFDYINSIEFLVQQNPKNKMALDYLLSYHLLNKDLGAFRTAYDSYAKTDDSDAEKIYAEALLVLLFRENASEQEFEAYGIRPEQLNDFISYTELFEQSEGELTKLQSEFGRSYWFYYHFATMKEGTK